MNINIDNFAASNTKKVGYWFLFSIAILSNKCKDVNEHEPSFGTERGSSAAS